MQYQGGLEEIKASLELLGELPEEFQFKHIPPTTWPRNVPKVPCQDTRQFDG